MTVSFMICLGDVINVYDKQMDGWWQGEKNGQVGIFPASYVEEIWPLPFNHPASEQVLVPLAENWLYGKFQHIKGGKWTFGQTLVTMLTSEFWMLKTGCGPRTTVYQPILGSTESDKRKKRCFFFVQGYNSDIVWKKWCSVVTESESNDSHLQ